MTICQRKFLSIFFLWIILSGFSQEPLEYRIFTKEGHQIHVVDFDPKAYKIISASAVNIKDRQTVSAIAKDNHAILGINGGFFITNDKNESQPAGVLKIKKDWIGFSSLPRAALGWQEGEETGLFDRILVKRKERIVVPLLDKSYHAKKQWQELDYIVGGTPLLIKNGKKIQSYSSEKTLKSFLYERHARTAICTKKSNRWIFVVASHTKEKYRAFTSDIVEGLTIPELTNFLQKIGCNNAINMDGGGSSTLVRDHQVMNHPAGDMDEFTHLFHERPVTDAILLIPY